MSSLERLSEQPKISQSIVTRHLPLKLFVGSLCKSTSAEVLFQYFSQFGDVRQTEVAMSHRGTSRGYGYVILQPQNVATTDILFGNIHVLEGSVLKIEEALDPEYRQLKHMQLAERRLYLSGIPSTVSQENIYEALKYFGDPVSVTNLRRSNPYSNPNSFYCYVTMDRPQAVKNILKKGSLILKCGTSIQAKRCKPRHLPGSGSNMYPENQIFLEKSLSQCSIGGPDPIQIQQPGLLGIQTTPRIRPPEKASFYRLTSAVEKSFCNGEVSKLQSTATNVDLFQTHHKYPGKRDRFRSGRTANCSFGRFCQADSDHARPITSNEDNLRYNIYSRRFRPGPSSINSDRRLP